MPYPQNTGRRVPTIRQTISVQFTHADGQAKNHPENAKVVGSTPEADEDTFITDHKLELDCGCFYPNVEVGGVCAECVRQGLPANICKEHFVVCECGEPCCWKHSRPARDRKGSLCPRCHLREKNAAMLKSAADGIRRICRAIFFRS
jgi:hypothetical protein